MLPSMCVFFFITVTFHSDFFAGKRSTLATESYNSSNNYIRQKPSVIFCVQFSTFLYICAIFYHFMNKNVQFGMAAECLWSNINYCNMMQVCATYAEIVSIYCVEG